MIGRVKWWLHRNSTSVALLLLVVLIAGLFVIAGTVGGWR